MASTSVGNGMTGMSRADRVRAELLRCGRHVAVAPPTSKGENDYNASQQPGQPQNDATLCPVTMLSAVLRQHNTGNG
jgi:hypothetical protein